MVNLTDDQKRAIFKALANNSQVKVGLDFGLDRHYKGNVGVMNAVSRIYKEVKEDFNRFLITPEVAELVELGMKDRFQRRHSGIVPLTDPNVSEKDLVLEAKRKAWVLLNQKLDYLAKNKKAFRNESIMSLAKLAGIVFDKSQIVRGEATEHIALKAKIDPNITSQEAIEQLLRYREAVQKEDEE